MIRFRQYFIKIFSLPRVLRLNTLYKITCGAQLPRPTGPTKSKQINKTLSLLCASVSSTTLLILSVLSFQKFGLRRMASVADLIAALEVYFGTLRLAYRRRKAHNVKVVWAEGLVNRLGEVSDSAVTERQ